MVAVPRFCAERAPFLRGNPVNCRWVCPVSALSVPRFCVDSFGQRLNEAHRASFLRGQLAEALQMRGSKSDIWHSSLT